eukprot:m.252892 g.252892  ORF g.252892 m.252892 type:complete len:957 (+) comp17528_c0_seq1:113-2983(+)
MLDWLIASVCLVVGFGISLRVQSAYFSKAIPAPANSRTQSFQNKLLTSLQQSLQQADVDDNDDEHAHHYGSVMRSPALQAKLETVVRQMIKLYVDYWYSYLSLDEPSLGPKVEELLWRLVDAVQLRFHQIDTTDFLAQDVVTLLTTHFHSCHRDPPTEFRSHPSIGREEDRLAYNRHLGECLLQLLLPSEELRSPLMRTLLREVVGVSVLNYTLEMLSSPDWINQQLVWHLDSIKQQRQTRPQSYAYAANYAAFVKLIEDCENVDELEDMRYHIIAELLQTQQVQQLQSLLKQGKADKKVLSLVQDTAKASHLKSRNLARYLNQCNYAKGRCEKRIEQLGGYHYSRKTNDLEVDGDIRLSAPKSQQETDDDTAGSLDDCLENGMVLGYFLQYLSPKHMARHLKCWLAIQDVRKLIQETHVVKYAPMLNAISIIHNVAPDVRSLQLPLDMVETLQPWVDKLTKDDSFEETTETTRVVTSLLLQAQKPLSIALEQQYRSFLLSEHYRNFVHHVGQGFTRIPRSPRKPAAATPRRRRGLSRSNSTTSELDLSFASETPSTTGSAAGSDVDDLDGQDTVTAEVLVELREKLKLAEGDVIVAELEGRSPEVLLQRRDSLQQQIAFVQRNMETVANYWLAVGTWQVEVQSISPAVKHETDAIWVEVAVHRAKEDHSSASHDGWVVYRELADFQRLHAQLKDVARTLPKTWKPKYKRTRDGTHSTWITLRKQLQALIDAILQDQMLQESQALYEFLKREQNSTIAMEATSDTVVEEEAPPLEGEDQDALLSEGDDELDSIAKPMYRLLAEIFGLRGVFQWMRRSLIAFARVTFGSSINKALREGVDWLFYEPQLMFYLDSFLENVLVEEVVDVPTRSPEEQEQTRQQAQELLIEMIPELLASLVGQTNCRKGFLGLFQAFQSQHRNRHVLYCFLELLLTRLFPELPARDLDACLIPMDSTQSE